jgi:hydrogenase maturation protein HypF
VQPVTHHQPNPDASTTATERCRLEVRGRVQGVGFRPFVYRLARQAGLVGHVGNDPRGAFIELEGPPEDIARFRDRLHAELPPIAAIQSVEMRPLAPLGEAGFRILPSASEGEQQAQITPDTATCADCLRELFDPSDRRHRYPFINCTHCGPRYSILRGVPYDRVNTTMTAFTMCDACQAEYDDPADRRFHAQPNACPACGPRVWLADQSGRELEGDAIAQAAERLRSGGILAVKGLGGFHLACRADDDAAVGELRRRKGREAKPLAMMAGSLDAAREIVELDDAAVRALTSPARPIVLAPKRPDAAISPQVAPASDCFGVMLPYTSLHELLFAEGLGPLVMTSGNPSAEPLCCDNAEALRRLGHIAEAFLMHDRDIERRVDDSVVMAVTLAGTPRTLPVRRARGFAPQPVRVPVEAQRPVLALGAELKSTVCLLTGRDAVLSEHLGELGHPAAYRHFIATIDAFERLLKVRPEVVACDLHPDYAATRFAHTLGRPVTEVQHHHAHIVACMAEHGLTGRVIGLACDGTGYGSDGTIWGGELLVCDEATFERAGHLRPFPLLGGDLAAVDTWRPALALLHETYAPENLDLPEVFRLVEAEPLAAMRSRLRSPESPPMRCSSLGRLFDAAAFLLGVCSRNRYEGEAAMALEALAASAPAAHPLPAQTFAPDGPVVLDFAPLVRALVDGMNARRPVAELARYFHESVAAMLADGAACIARRTGLTRVMLSGGCFMNRLLLARLWELLTSRGLAPYTHCVVPPGDGGIALGQAVCAAARMQKGAL